MQFTRLDLVCLFHSTDLFLFKLQKRQLNELVSLFLICFIFFFMNLRKQLKWQGWVSLFHPFGLFSFFLYTEGVREMVKRLG